MEMIPVDSSNLKAIGYEKGTVEIEFKNGNIYRYCGVPEIVFRGFFISQSPGWYFHKIFKISGYEYTRLGEQNDQQAASGFLGKNAA
jgi:hypothetical protein